MKKIILLILLAGSLAPAQAAIYQYSLNFVAEGNPSPGTGSGTVVYDDVNHLLQLQATFSGLMTTNLSGQPSSGTTASHLHATTAAPNAGNAGVATTTPSLAGFPLGVYSGSFSNTLNLTQSGSWNPAFVTANGGSLGGAEAALFSAMNQSRAYWNIHSQAFGGGEIRGWIVPVPEPSGFALAGLGLAALAARVWSKRRTDQP